MDGHRFDDLVRALATSPSRRRFLRVAASGALGGLAGVIGRGQVAQARRGCVADPTRCDASRCQFCNLDTDRCELSCDREACERCDGAGVCLSRCDSDRCRICDGVGGCVLACNRDDCQVCDGAGVCVSTCGQGEVCDGAGGCAPLSCVPAFGTAGSVGCCDGTSRTGCECGLGLSPQCCDDGDCGPATASCCTPGVDCGPDPGGPNGSCNVGGRAAFFCCNSAACLSAGCGECEVYLAGNCPDSGRCAACNEIAGATCTAGQCGYIG